VLLRDALQDADRVAIVKIALRQREQLATLRVRDDVLVLNTMLWPDEVRGVDFGFLDEDIETRPAELAMASSLIDSMAGSFKPDEFTDNYRAALQEVIDAKVEGREIVAPEETEEQPAAAVDLMAALKASVERAKKARGESPEERARTIEATPMRDTAKKTTAKKAAPAKATKSAAAAKKKAPAKKAAKKAKAPAKKRTPNAAFMKPLTPDPALSAVVGAAPLPRTEIVSKLWAYIKKNKLQDNENKRMVNADDKLRTLFGKNQVSMFELAGIVGKHLSAE
jgi:DNA end-binding protein Ku